MKSRALIIDDEKHICFLKSELLKDEDYITITSGDGVYVFDENNKKYLDAAGGVCVVNIGHGV